MDKIKRFFECLIPITACNLKCLYCYVIQENRRRMQLAELQYTPQHIAEALTKERLGGTCFFSICGAGETLMQKEVIDIVKLLLEEGHYVNITTNGTLSKKFDLLIAECRENIKRLHISFSLHYLELKRLNLLQVFFENIKKMRKAGASILLQFNLCDEYIPYIDEIKEISLKEIGAYPQVALTRDESSRPMKIYTSLSNEEYYRYGKEFKSPLFDFTCENFNVERKEFCYAGDWSGLINLQTGWFSKCYRNQEGQNIFENINRPINFEAVGRNCKNLYCINSSHFMSLGVIPSIQTPTYAELRNRENANWYSDEMKQFLNGKLKDNNVPYGIVKRQRLEIKNKFLEMKIAVCGLRDRMKRK